MKSKWTTKDARAAIARLSGDGISDDLALRVYTTRLLGSDGELVLHGGGNTSLKTSVRDIDGREVDVLCVKGSGWDMGGMEPPGLPAVRLAPLLELEALETMSDEDMVAFLRCNLLQPDAPTPSVETLLHAFLPHKYVDHTHANAVLALSDQPDGQRLCEDLYAERAGVLPFVMPGFELAKACAAAWRASRDVEGLILSKHGLFSFGATAEESYERMIALVDLAERKLAAGTGNPFVQVKMPDALAAVEDIAPLLRGRLAVAKRDGGWRRVVLAFRTNPDILRFAGGEKLRDYATRGPVTPDHVIRIKPEPLIVPPPQDGRLDAFQDALEAAVRSYIEEYDAYFARNNARAGGTKTMLDPLPRVVIVPGLGLFATGGDARAADIAADLAEANIAVVTRAEAFGRYEPLGREELFDMEYWSLEQAKLRTRDARALSGRIVAITGGAGAIGRATARAFVAQGAAVALIDLAGDGLPAAAEETGALPVTGDLTDDGATEAAFARIVRTFGGLDILVSNAGAAWQGRIGAVDETAMRASFELNFWGHQRAARAAVAIMQKQGTGGALLFNISKQAVNPGPGFGPYGIPKAATLALMRQYALEYGDQQITSNAVNADRIRSGLLSGEMIAERSRARKVSEADYMSGNLLRREVEARDVARAFVDLARSRATTGAVLTVDGGNVAAMMR